ncbi:MAG: hypothetical protein NTY19_50970 [Planctomycetota bacterium]|nr:hypothetical protein [Planctomycetota bacterium]
MTSITPQDENPQAPAVPADAKPGCTLPGCASCLTGLLLLAMVITTWLVFFLGKDNVRDALSWSRMALILVLLLVIPLLLYKVLKLWLEGASSQFPDIDMAWEDGVETLGQHGLTVDALPVFLVLGSSGELQEQALMQAAGFEYEVRAVPEGDAPLHWYATRDAIYLFCTGASWLSVLSRLAEQWPEEAVTIRPAVAAAPAASPYAAVAAPAPAMPPPPAAPARPKASAPGSERGTILLDQFLQQQPQPARPVESPAPVATAPASSGPPGPAYGTVMLDAFPVETPRQAATGVDESLAVVSPAAASEQLQHLQYVCQLLRGARRPLCAINGVLTLLPFQAIRANQAEAEELQHAIQSDLLTIQRALQLRFPVTALVTGLDRERGFSELVRRVGPERAVTQRFGRKFDVRSLATPEELTALCEHVCGAFEDWVYALFREHQALTRPGNTRLYGLLCKVRCSLKPRLGEVLRQGFGHDRRERPDDDPFLFSGCYFAATGDTPDRQAFLRGVLEKLVEEQEYVEWTPAALAQNRRYQRLGYAGLCVAGLLLLTLATMIVRLVS